MQIGVVLSKGRCLGFAGIVARRLALSAALAAAALALAGAEARAQTEIFPGNVIVNGQFNSLSVLTQKLEVIADTRLGGNVVIGDLNVQDTATLTVDATSTFLQPVTMTGTLTTGGKATLDSLEVTKDAAVKGGLTVEKDAAVKGGLTVEQDAAVKGSLTVEKDATVKGKLTVESDTEVKGALTVAKGATVSESFTITPGSLISMGGNRVQDVADPLLDTDAANKRYVDAGFAAVNTKLASAFKEIDKNSQGIAIAMAMSGLALPSDEHFALGVNMGFFEDNQAVALQAAVRVNPFVTITGGFGTGVQDVGTVGGRVGMQVAW
jgi:hypothetical protein